MVTYRDKRTSLLHQIINHQYKIFDAIDPLMEENVNASYWQILNKTVFITDGIAFPGPVLQKIFTVES